MSLVYCSSIDKQQQLHTTNLINSNNNINSNTLALKNSHTSPSLQTYSNALKQSTNKLFLNNGASNLTYQSPCLSNTIFRGWILLCN